MFAAKRGISDIIEPYTIQTTTPNSSISSIGSDISFVCFVLIALNDCGKKANVVSDAAINPTINVVSKLVNSVN